MIIAKPIVPNQFWILRHNDQKIGNIQAADDGFMVCINNHVEKFKTITTIKKRANINFEPWRARRVTAVTEKTVHGYPTTRRPYNAIYDVKHKVPLWTKEPRSKSWYAAGWYRVKTGKNWEVVQCPKLILLERYPYAGPFNTQDQAKDS